MVSNLGMNINKDQLFDALWNNDSIYFENIIITAPNHIWNINYIKDLVMHVENNDRRFFGESDRIFMLVIFRLLSLFGIKKFNIPYRRLTQVQNINIWLNKYMSEKFVDARVQNAIRNNKILLEFLQTIINLVNYRFFNTSSIPLNCL